MKTDGIDELLLRPLQSTDIGPLVAAGYGSDAETTAMVNAAIDARGRGQQRPMVITRRCVAPDPRGFTSLRVTDLVLGLISDLGEVWLTSDSTARPINSIKVESLGW